jgi:hypothetical protein
VSRRFFKLPDALADSARRKGKFLRRLSHLPGARHGDKSLQQRKVSDHKESLAQLNRAAQSVACGSSVSA